ncbi:MAG: hypothetical protein OXR64_15300 [Chloroflexota bacterium]|nr:hypothetical protein [Chloroflexota bacterium]MDE2921202.1 hypothetical protein [Chloroflexota bacterium]
MSRVRLHAARLAVLLVAVVALGACEVGAMQTAIENPTPDPVTALQTTCTPPSCEELAVQIGDFAILPPVIRTSAPRVRFAITNIGAYTHSLEVRLPGGVVSSPRIGPGQTGYLEADLEPGTYEALDPTPGHAVRGARASLVAGPGS